RPKLYITGELKEIVPDDVKTKWFYGRCYSENCWNATSYFCTTETFAKNATTRCVINSAKQNYCMGDYCLIRRE
ncbi:hypothetical protein PENTCL1PPCAC_20281, partial [Pristionchus entomophagus]